MSNNKHSSTHQEESFDKMIVYTDGASRGNPGPSGAGISVSLKDTSTNLAVFLGNKTNNEAEYSAVLIALRFIDKLARKNGKKVDLKLCGIPSIVVRLDSQLVVNQLNGSWKIKDSRMKKYVSKIKRLSQELPYLVRFEHIGREKNQLADWLANQALDLAEELLETSS